MNVTMESPAGISFEAVPMTEEQYIQMRDLPERLPHATYQILQTAKDKIDTAQDWNGAIRDYMADDSFMKDMTETHKLKKNDILYFLCGRKQFCE